MPFLPLALLLVLPAAEPKPPENIARGASYALSPAPNYKLCTDADDKVQLTDGKTTKDYFWTQRGTVGWSNASHVQILVDLKKVEPIAGVAITAAAGKAGVGWPLGVEILTSEDAKAWRHHGDLVSLDRAAHGPLPDQYAIRKLATTALQARGRYVLLVIIPGAGSPYTFTDEVEVYRGAAALLAGPLQGTTVDNPESFWKSRRVALAIGRRWSRDLAAIESCLAGATLTPEVRKTLASQLASISAGMTQQPAIDPATFRAVLPLGAPHAALFKLQAAIWRAAGGPTLSAWVACPWDPTPLIGPLPAQATGTIRLHAMRGEFRAAAINLANRDEKTQSVRLRLRGFDGRATPPWLSVCHSPWTDSSAGEAVTAALLPIEPSNGGWTVQVEPGLLSHVWLTVHPVDLAPRDYSGSIEIAAEGQPTISVPVELRVWPLEFPAKPRLLVGGWCYTNRRGSRGVTDANRAAFVKHLQEHYVNCPWATSSVMLNGKFDPRDVSKVTLDTAEMDQWLADWPAARRYMVFVAVDTSLGHTRYDAPDFNRRVAAWISAWVRHLQSKGIEPDRLGLLLHDEPHEGTDVAPLLAWMRAIRAAEPRVRLFEDPTYKEPQKAPPELFELSHLLCPNRPMWLSDAKRFNQFYLAQRDAGRTLQFYSCSGPARSLDPYSYYRLQAWHVWQIGGNGSSFWSFSDNSGSSSWNEYLAASGPYTPLFLDDRSVVAGKQMEAVRESVEDFELLAMLGDAIAKAKAVPAQAAAVTRAASVLESAVTRVLADETHEAGLWRIPKDRTRADAVRPELLDALLSLEGKSPTAGK